MGDKIKRDLRILKAWALSSSILCLFFIFGAAKQGSEKTKFTEIDVERINIVEKDGKLRLTISNNERSPGPVIGGLVMKSREGKRGAGFIFFNDKGDECGGMTWASSEEGGKIRANAGLMFDQYNQDQTVGITYSQQDAERSAGLQVWDRPLTPLAEFARRLGEIESLPDSAEKNAAAKKLREEAAASGLAGTSRVFVGRNRKNEALVSLSDSKGKPRILVSVDAADQPSLQFLDENGKVMSRIPEGPKPEPKSP